MLFGVAVKIKIHVPLLLLFFSFAAGFIVGKYGIAYYESSAFKPWSWFHPPAIVNCYGNDLELVYMARGADYWIANGEEISFVEATYIENVCKHDHIDGFILLKKAKRGQLSDGTLAITERKASIVRGMVSATIYFQPGAFKIDYIVEHELGHAFGYTHVDIEGHIMHPNFNMMSEKFWMP